MAIYRTGSIIPLGDGATGKTALTSLLIKRDVSIEEAAELLAKTKKSVNIEMEFISVSGKLDGQEIKASCQFYVFPGQRQKNGINTPTFEEILRIFDFLPMLENVSVLLLLWDTTRLESLKSLESWLQIALSRQWVGDDTLIVLVSNKIDLQESNPTFVENVKQGIIKMIKAGGRIIDESQVRSISTSCVDLRGVHELQAMIDDWVLWKGMVKKNS